MATATLHRLDAAKRAYVAAQDAARANPGPETFTRLRDAFTVFWAALVAAQDACLATPSRAP